MKAKNKLQRTEIRHPSNEIFFHKKKIHFINMFIQIFVKTSSCITMRILYSQFSCSFQRKCFLLSYGAIATFITC